MIRSLRLLLTAITLAGTCVTVAVANISDADLATQIKVNGALVSSAGETALVNSRLVRPGERVGDIEIIAVEAGLVHMRVADRTFSMQVGSSAIKESRYAAAVEMPASATWTLPGNTDWK